MRRKFRTMLSTALVVSMLGTMFGGSAFGAGTGGGLFADNERAKLIVTDNSAVFDPDWVKEGMERYQSQLVPLASPSNALIASNSDAVAASPSNAVQIEYDEAEGMLKLKTSKDIVHEAGIPREDDGKQFTVTLTASDADKTYTGEADIRWNWFGDAFNEGQDYEYNRSSNGYSKLSRSTLYAGNFTPLDRVTIDNFQFYTYAGDREIKGVKLDKVQGESHLCIDWSEAKENGSALDRSFERQIRVEMKENGEVIGYCYVALPMYSIVNGDSCVSIEAWLADNPDLSDGELHITSGQISDDDWAAIAANEEVKKLYIGSSVTQFDYAPGYEAFKGNHTLEEVFFNYEGTAARRGSSRSTGSLLEISTSMFEGCTALKKVSMPGINSTDNSAFKGCTALKEIDAPDLVQMGEETFSGCTALEEVNLPALQFVYAGAFQDCTSLRKAGLPKIYDIYAGVFKNCTALKEMILPGYYVSFEQDGETVFEGVELPLSYTLVGSDGKALTGEALTTAQKIYAGNPIWGDVLDLENPNPVNKKVEFSVTFAGETQGIIASGDNVEECIQKLLSINTKKTLSDIERIDGLMGIITEADWRSLEQLSGLKVLDIGNSSSPVQVDSVSIPAVQMPKSLITFNLYTISSMLIPDNMFRDCAKLDAVRMNRVESIGSYAFANCTKLGTGQGLWLPDTPPTLGSDVFAGMDIRTGAFHTTSGDLDSYREAGGQWTAWVTGGTTPPPSRPSQGGSSSREKASYGTWVADANGWKYVINNKNAVGQWAYLPYNSEFSWYYFDQNGYMMSGWFTDAEGRSYYLHPFADGTRGHMYTGWNQIDGKWYYFSEQEGSANGMLFKNTTTPDGYKVDDNGIRIQ